MQLLLNFCDVEVLSNIDDVLLDATLRFDVSDVVLLDAILTPFLNILMCAMLQLYFLFFFLETIDLESMMSIDVHLVSLDVLADVDASMLDVHPILCASLCS